MRALIKEYGIPTTMLVFGIAVMIVMSIFAQFVKPPPPGYVQLGLPPCSLAF